MVVEIEQALPLKGIRVLVLFGGSEFFGQERANIEVFNALAPLGLAARFVLSRRWGSAIRPELQRLGFEMTEADYGFHWGRNMLARFGTHLFLNLLGVLQTSWRIWREIRNWKPTHIYCPNWMFYTYAAPALACSRLPFIFRAGDELPEHTWFNRWMSKRLLKRVTTFVCNAKFVQASTIARGLPARKARVIYNFPPRRAPGQHLEIPEIPPGAIVILFIGQISEHKGVPLFVNAMVDQLKVGKNYIVWLAGDSTWGSPLRKDLEVMVSAAGLSERFHFFGYVEDVTQLLARADIHVCPSVWNEPSPNVVLEAKLAGLPSVVFPKGGIPELIEHRVDGYICDACAPEKLVEGVAYFAEHTERRKQAGLAAQRSLESRFGLKRFQREWGEVFLTTLNTPIRHPIET